MLSFYQVNLPNFEKLKKDTKKWYLLTKEDFKFIISESTITHASLIKFLMSSGMRLSDALSLTIGDFMEATKEYHNYVDVDKFIDNAPQDMVGSWHFHPHKTRRFNLECQTFNDPESSNLILQNLRKIKDEYIPKLNNKSNSNLTVSKSDALFASRKGKYKGHLSQRSVSDIFFKKNKKLRKHRIALIEEKIKNGEISKDDFDKYVNKIPKFHAHACRKYFETMISRNCGDLRICTLMEGHASPVRTDSSYIKKNVEDVKEAYLLSLPDLSLENTEVKVYTSDVRREMEEKIFKLENQNDSLKSELNKFDDILNRLSKLEEKS